MLRKLIAFILLVVAVPTLSAQDATPTPVQDLGNAPVAILDALNALNIQLGGIGLVLTDLNSYSWAEEVFNDTSLGCPQEGQNYTATTTRGFVFVFVYRDTVYDYRTSQDGTTVFLCDSYPVQQPATRTPLDSGTVIDETNAGNIREVARLNAASVLAASSGKVIAVSGGGEAGGVNIYSTDALNNAQSEFYDIGEITALAVASDSDQTVLAAANTDGTINFFPVSSTGFDGVQMEADVDVDALAISPDLLVVAAGGDDGIALYSASSGALLVSIESDNPITALAFGEGLLAAGDSEGLIYLYAVTITGNVSVEYEALDILTGHSDTVHDLEFNETSTLLASGSSDQSARLWNTSLAEGTLGVEVANLSSGADAPILAVAFSGDVVATAEDDVVRLWSATDRTILATLTGHDEPITSLDFALDGRLLMSSSGVRLSCGARNMQLWIDGALREWMPIHEFRARHALPETFGIPLFHPKDFTGRGSIQGAGKALNLLQQQILDAVPQGQPPQGWQAFTLELQLLFHRKLREVNPQVGLHQSEIEYAVAGFGDVTQAYTSAMLAARMRGQSPPAFDELYQRYLNQSVLTSSQSFPYIHHHQEWQITLVQYIYGMMGLIADTDQGRVYVADPVFACPAERFMTGLLREVTARIRTAAYEPR